MGEMISAYRNLIGNPVGKRVPGRSRDRKEDSIEMGVEETGCGLDSFGSG
jgi:hypothetical protein